MRLARFMADGKDQWGVVHGDELALVRGDVFGGFGETDHSVPLASVALLPPCRPEKCVCVGLNYSDHAAELNMPVPDEPILFLKPPTSLCAPFGDIAYPPMTRELHYEAELAVVVGRGGRNIPEARAADHILGYACANDVTARDLQRKDGQWTRAKGFDTFLPVGPWLETDLDPGSADIRLRLNGEIRQSSNTGRFIFSVPRLVSFISRIMTLAPGDVIITGTPPGVGPMEVGDEVVVEIEGLGALSNRVVAGE